MESFSLVELSRLSGIEPRTIRSYIYQGLLRGPEAVGRNARYSRHHLDRLRAIRSLREGERLSLNEIRQRLVALSDDQIGTIGEPSAGAAPKQDLQEAASALDYIRALRERLRADERETIAPDRPVGPSLHESRDDSVLPYPVATAPAAAAIEPLHSSLRVQEQRAPMAGFEAADADRRSERVLRHMEELAGSLGKLTARLDRYEHEVQDLHELGLTVRELRRQHEELLRRVAALQSDVENLQAELSPLTQKQSDQVLAERDESGAGKQAGDKDR